MNTCDHSACEARRQELVFPPPNLRPERAFTCNLPLLDRREGAACSFLGLSRISPVSNARGDLLSGRSGIGLHGGRNTSTNPRWIFLLTGRLHLLLLLQ